MKCECAQIIVKWIGFCIIDYAQVSSVGKTTPPRRLWRHPSKEGNFESYSSSLPSLEGWHVVPGWSLLARFVTCGRLRRSPLQGCADLSGMRGQFVVRVIYSPMI